MNYSLSSASLRAFLLLLLIGVVLAAESASSSGHFSIDDHIAKLNQYKKKFEQIIASIKEECKNIGGSDPCGPCLADILKTFEEGEASSIASDDNTSS